MKTKYEIVQEFNNFDNDVDRWKWVKENQDQKHLPKVDLDNDDTSIWIEEGEDEGEFLQFDYYIGWGDGVESLLEAMGIKAESV